MRRLTAASRKIMWVRSAVASLVSLLLLATMMPVAAQAAPDVAGAVRAEAAAAAEVVQTIGTTREFWDAANVSPTVQRKLEADLRAGKLPESMKSGSTPVRTATAHQDGNRVSTEIFSDGSVSRTLVQEEPGVFDGSALGLPDDEFSTTAIHNGSITSCTVSGGTGFARRDNCAVKGSNGGAVTLGFTASYTLIQGTYNDTITARHTPYQQCNAGVCDSPTWNRWVREESRSGGKALVSMLCRWEVSSVSSGTAELQLLVGANAASARLIV